VRLGEFDIAPVRQEHVKSPRSSAARNRKRRKIVLSIGLISLAVVAGLALVSGGFALFTGLTARQAEALAPPIGHFLEVDGARLHYLDRGTGPAVVLVHGLGGNLRNFHAIVDRLAATCRVVAVDRPGSGYSTMMSGAHPALRAQARIIARFCGTLGLDRAVLVGHSLGGALSLALALDHPDSVAALVLISPLSHVQRERPAVFKALDIHSPTLRWLIAWTLMAPLGKLAHHATLKAVFAPEAVPNDFDAESGGGLGLRPGNFIAASEDMITVSDELALMTPRYPSLAIPVDVIFGRQDPILNYQAHGERLVAALPNARLHLIDGGHMIPITVPDQIVHLIRQAAEQL
jgi:pimeloyl-ACP methyl ester carboxylesterase